MSRRLFHVLSLLVLAGMLLAACQPAAQPFTCEDPLGCVSVGPNQPIRLAYAMVISGPNETLGVDSRRGIEIAIDDKDGTLLGHPIELTGEDTLCNAEGGQAAAQKLAADQSIVAIIGTSCSSEAAAAAPILSDAGFTMVSPSNTAPVLTDPATHAAGYLRTAHNDLVQGRVAAEFAYNSLGVTRAATIHDGSPYAQGLVDSFESTFTELGGEIVAAEAVQDGDTDMRPVLTTISAASPELIYYPIFVDEGGLVTAQAREVSGLENVHLMGADGMFSPDFLEAAGPAAEGMYHSSPDFSAFGSAYNDFLAKHQEKYGEAPLSAFHAHAYDAANIIFAAIEEVAIQGEDGSVHIPRQALRDAIYATQGFQGLTGTLNCNETVPGVKFPGDCGDPHIAVYQTVNPDAAAWNPGASADSNPMKIYP